MSENQTITIALVDDHDMIHNGVQLLLRKDNRYQILHQSYDGSECLDKLADQPVDLILSDISMPAMDGLTLTKIVKDQYPEIKVLLLTMHNEDEIIYDAIDANADGYVLKNTTSKELKYAIEKVIDGGIHYSDEIIEKITKGLQHHKKEKVEISLTERELEVVQLLCDEYTTKEIAQKLFLSPNTIETHRKNILKKTGCRSTVGLVRFAILHQLIEL